MFYSSNRPFSIYRFSSGLFGFGNCVVCRFGYFDYLLISFLLSLTSLKQETLRKKDTKRNGPGSWLLTCPNHQRRRRPLHPPLLVSFQPSEKYKNLN